MIDLSLVLKQLRSISDEQLRTELQRHGLSIPDEKFTIAFSSYGLTRWLSGVPVDILRQGAPPTPDQELNAIRWRSVFIFRAYTAFIYMRSAHLETGLDNISNDSCLLPFKRFFGSGSQKQNEDTIAQHLRNSLSHGSFSLSHDLQTVSFSDRQWQARIALQDFIDGLCEEVFRFYVAAFEANNRPLENP
jgi:hypothetical protein